VRLGARSTSVRERIDPAEGSPSPNFSLLDSLRKTVTRDVQQVDPANSLSKCFNELPSAFENLLKTQGRRVS
jgi:hypothetical protein